MADTNAEPETPVPPSDCFCAWITESEMKQREAAAAAAKESRTEAARLLHLAEARAAGDAGLLTHIAMAWKDLGRLH